MKPLSLTPRNGGDPHELMRISHALSRHAVLQVQQEPITSCGPIKQNLRTKHLVNKNLTN